MTVGAVLHDRVIHMIGSSTSLIASFYPVLIGTGGEQAGASAGYFGSTCWRRSVRG